MPDIIGGPAKLEVCEDCPHRSKRTGGSQKGVWLEPGEAHVTVDEDHLDGVYVSAEGKDIGSFGEAAMALYMDNLDAFRAFERCSGRENIDIPNPGLLGRIGIKKMLTVEICPALQEIFENPHDAKCVKTYLEGRGL